MLNKEVVENFYNAFSLLDYSTLKNYLSPNVIYNDPVFGLLEGDAVFKLWKMKCERLREFSFEFGNIEELDNEYATCEWKISFFHRPTGDVVTMPGKAHLRILNNLIAEHSDAYKMSDWLAASKGLRGKLLGWTGFMKRKEQNIYRRLLDRYINTKQIFSNEEKRSHDYDFSDR